MYLNFKYFLCAVIMALLMVFSVNAASGTEEKLLEFANDYYYKRSDATASYSIYQQAKEMGNILAKAQIAKMLYLGVGVDEDKNLAQAWFQQVLPQLKNAAQQGDAFAQYLYGYYWDLGFIGSISDTKAVYWYQQAAEQGSTPAQFNLAVRYQEANGVTKDLVKAVYWYQLAADQGHLLSQYQLGNKYNRGEGVAKDPVKAVYWYQLAADEGHANAQYELGDKFYYGKGVKKSTDDAIYWYKKAAFQDNVKAQEKLGYIYYSDFKHDKGNPDSVPKNSYEAKLWLKMAVANGSTWAQGELAALQAEQRQTEAFFENMKIVADFYNGDIDPDNWSYTTQKKYCSAASEGFSIGMRILKDTVKGGGLSSKEKHGLKKSITYALSLQNKYCE